MPGLIFSREGRDYPFGLAITAVDFQTLQAKMSQYLHPQEFDFFKTLKYEKRQYQFLLGRHCVKEACLSLNPGLDPTSLCVSSGVFNQPLINQVHTLVSLSHVAPWCVAVVGPDTHPVAIDIERISPEHQATIRSCLTSEEQALVNTMKALDPTVASTLFWTAREALAKALKTGFCLPLEYLAIKSVQSSQSSQCGEGVDQMRYYGEYCHFSQYSFFGFRFGNYVISLAHPKGSICGRLDAFTATGTIMGKD